MARAIVAPLFACALLDAGAALAQSGAAVGASAGIGFVYPLGDASGGGNGFYADVEYRLSGVGWLTPRLYGGALLTSSDPESCDQGVSPCDVSARIGFVGAKARLMLPIPRIGPFVELGIGGSVGQFSTRSGQAVDVSRSGVTYHVPFAIGVALGGRYQWQLALVMLFHPEMEQAGGGLVLGYDFKSGSAGSGEGAVAEGPSPAEEGGVPPGAGPSGGVEPVAPEASPPVAPGPAAAVAVVEPETTAQPPEPEAAPRKRGKTYVAAWLGYGGGAVHGSEGTTEFVPYLGIPVPLSAGAGFGVPVGRRVLVGAEWNITLGINCVASMDEASGACDRVVLLQHLLAMATFFPLWEGAPEVAPAGLFVRGGAGLALLNSWPEDIASTSASADAEPGARWKRTGAGVLAGLGWALRINETRTLDFGLDLAFEWYGTSAAEPEQSFSTVFHGGIAFH